MTIQLVRIFGKVMDVFTISSKEYHRCHINIPHDFINLYKFQERQSQLIQPPYYSNPSVLAPSSKPLLYALWLNHMLPIMWSPELHTMSHQCLVQL